MTNPKIVRVQLLGHPGSGKTLLMREITSTFDRLGLPYVADHEGHEIAVCLRDDDRKNLAMSDAEIVQKLAEDVLLPRTIEIDGMQVPSLGKYEAEWALRKIMGDPLTAKGYLIDAIMIHFQECREEATKFANAAFAKYAQMTGAKFGK